MWTILLKICCAHFAEKYCQCQYQCFSQYFYPLYAAVKLFPDQVSFWCSIQVNLWIDCQCPAVVELSICFLFLFWAAVCKTVCPMPSDRVCLSLCLSLILSVMLVYYGQTVRWIKMPLGTEVGHGTDDTVVDGDPAPQRKGAQQPPLLAHVYCGQTVTRLSNWWAVVSAMPYGIANLHLISTPPSTVSVCWKWRHDRNSQQRSELFQYLNSTRSSALLLRDRATCIIMSVAILSTAAHLYENHTLKGLQ